MQFLKLLISATLLFATFAVGADRLTIPGHFDRESTTVLPRRGSNMDQVLQNFGEPIRRINPVGEPPITEWDYGDFRVYFEYQIVLHTVDLTTMIMPKE